MDIKKCTRCLKHKTISLFARNKRYKTGIDSRCLDCKALESKEYYLKNKTKYNDRRKGYSRNIRLRVLKHYGGDTPSCACCGETTYEFLSLDHIDGGGNDDRKVNGAGTQFQLYLIRNSFPQGIQVLCHNCNLAKGFYGTCPHEVGRDI